MVILLPSLSSSSLSLSSSPHKAIHVSSGASSMLLCDAMTRAPVVRFSSALRASQLKFFLRDAPPVPALSFSPLWDKIIFLKRRALPPLAELARPEEKLAGIRIDGKCNTRSRMSSVLHGFFWMTL